MCTQTGRYSGCPSAASGVTLSTAGAPCWGEAVGPVGLGLGGALVTSWREPSNGGLRPSTDTCPPNAPSPIASQLRVFPPTGARGSAV